VKVDFTWQGQLFDMDVPDSQVRQYAIDSLKLSAVTSPGWEMREAKLKHTVNPQGKDLHEVHLDGQPIATLSDSDLRAYATSQLGMVRPGPATRQELAQEAQLATSERLETCRERFNKAMREHGRAHDIESEGAARFSFLLTEDGQDLWDLLQEAELKETRAQTKLKLANVNSFAGR
jgi:hypothetical protein